MITKEFTIAKHNGKQKLDQAIKSNEVDTTILPVLIKINQYPHYYTTSSCSGRIQFLELPQIGDKKNAKILGKWHQTITKDELIEVVSKASKGTLWLLAQSPIIHIASASFGNANIMVKKGIQAGFKNSAIKTLGKHLTIEIASTERLDAPVGVDGVLFASSKLIDLYIKISNEIIIKSQNKLDQFLKVI